MDKTPNFAKYAVMTLLNSVNLELHFLSVKAIFQERRPNFGRFGLGQKSEVLDSSQNVHFPKLARVASRTRRCEPAFGSSLYVFIETRERS
jgi:hypothetical protein